MASKKGELGGHEDNVKNINGSKNRLLRHI